MKAIVREQVAGVADGVQPMDEDDETYALDILEENWPVLEMFVNCGTQWRYGQTGRPLGLDYAGLAAAMQMAETADKRAMFRNIRVMEQAVMEEMNGR